MSDKGYSIFNIRPHHALGLDTELILISIAKKPLLLTTFRETNINFLEKCTWCQQFGQCFKQKLARLKVESGFKTLAPCALLIYSCFSCFSVLGIAKTLEKVSEVGPSKSTI